MTARLTDGLTDTNAVAQPPIGRPMLFIECTNTYRSAVQTGIQRVVRNILRHAGAVAAEHGFDMVPVVLHGGQFRAASLDEILRDKLQGPQQPPRRGRWPRMRRLYHDARSATAAALPHPAVRRFLFAHPIEFGLAWCLMTPLRLWRMVQQTRPVQPADPLVLRDGLGLSLDASAKHSGNVLLLLDASWHLRVWPAVARFQRAGGDVQSVVYDLVPLTHSDATADGLRAEFLDWMRQSLRHRLRYLAISRTVAGQLDGWLAEQSPRGVPLLPARPFYLGSELDFSRQDSVTRPEVQAVFDGPLHVFIVVGSIEPRKNHSFILDAFEDLWRTGVRAKLVIIGRSGWKNEDLVARITGHAQYRTQLFLLRDIDDSELGYAYGEASALVIASTVEGFGLPVVEAFQRGLPVLCSDIPVFREIADGRATFFHLASPQNLADAVSGFCAAHDPQLRRQRQPSGWITWRESTGQLLDAVLATGPIQGPAMPPS